MEARPLELRLGLLATWAAALGALFVHPALWALFALLLGAMIYRGVRTGKSTR